MHEMQIVVIDVHDVCLSVVQLNSALLCKKQIKILFRVNTFGGPKNIVLDGGPDPPTARGAGFDAAFARLL